MDTIRKYDLMEKMVHELEDLKNSQQALLVKLGKLEVDNINLGDKRLDADLPTMHQRVTENLDSVVAILDYFGEQTKSFNSSNNVDSLKEQEIIDNL